MIGFSTKMIYISVKIVKIKEKVKIKEFLNKLFLRLYILFIPHEKILLLKYLPYSLLFLIYFNSIK